MRDGVTRPETHAGIVTALRDVVVYFPLVFLATKLAGDLGGELVGEGEEDLGAESLQEGAPGLTGQRRAQRADALRSHNGDALGLAGEGEELLVAGRVVLAHG